MTANKPLDRRSFIKKSAAGLTAGAAALGAGLPVNSTAGARPRSGGSDIKVGLYSITYMGLWYDGRELTIPEVIDRARRFGYDGIEIDGKRPHGSPLDLDRDACAKIRRHADRQGIEIPAFAGNNCFISPIMEQREYEMIALKEQMRLASWLGVPIVRVFAGWVGVTLDSEGIAQYTMAKKLSGIASLEVELSGTGHSQWDWCLEGLKEAARIAERFKITLALQNHEPLMKSWQDTIKMAEQVGSEYLKMSLDAPLLKKQDNASVAEAVKKTGDMQIHSHFGGEYKKESDGSITQLTYRPDRGPTNYAAFSKALKEIGYNGYTTYELCHPFKVQGGRWGKLSDVDEQAELACKYMKNTIASA
jgi:sugar phosphate isomerase/epimerase